MNRTESKATRSKFHDESSDNLFTYIHYCCHSLLLEPKNFCNQRNHFEPTTVTKSFTHCESNPFNELNLSAYFIREKLLLFGRKREKIFQ